MARVTGPLFSVSASGTVGKAFTFGIWKGIQYVREWFKPENPQTVKQVNVRTALTLMVAYWQTLDAENKAAWESMASGFQMSGYNYFMRKGMDQYIVQHGVDITPTGVSYVNLPPAEVWTWTII